MHNALSSPACLDCRNRFHKSKFYFGFKTKTCADIALEMVLDMTQKASSLGDLVWKSWEILKSPTFHGLLNDANHLPSLLEDLVCTAAKVQLSDLGFDISSLRALTSRGRDPVFYLPVVDSEFCAMDLDKNVTHPENPANVMTVAVFMLKPKARLPLHDHPKMIGILKVA